MNHTNSASINPSTKAQTQPRRLLAQNIHKSYKKRRVIENISFEVHQGEIVSLLGPNGSGKTTSFYTVIGLVEPDQGEVYLDATPITYLPIHKRGKLGIGYLPQEASIFRQMSVEGNIMAALELHCPRSQRLSKLNAIIEEFKIGHIRKSLGISLSGGERRRVEIARCIASNPDFILFDEPFAGVDPVSIQEMKQIITALKHKGIGILITDHNVQETLDLSDRSYVLIGGKIVAQGGAEEIYRDPLVRKAYLGDRFSGDHSRD